METTKAVGIKALIIFMLATVSATAQNLLLNGSFESGTFTQNNLVFPDRMDLVNGSTAVTGWTVGSSSAGYVWWLEGPDYNAQDGNRAIDLDSNGHQPYGYIQQTFATTPGMQYKVSGYFASEFNGGPAVTTVQINGNVIGTATTGSGNYGGISFNNLIWTSETFNFTADSTSSTLRFQDDTTVNGPNGYDNPVIDDISVQAVPDATSTWLLLSLSLSGLFWHGRKSRAA